MIEPFMTHQYNPSSCYKGFEDNNKSFFVYQIQTQHTSQIGLLATLDIHNKKILPHELTFKQHEKMLLSELKKAGVQKQPIMLVHEHDDIIEKTLYAIVRCNTGKIYRDDQGIVHSFWQVNDVQLQQKLQIEYQNIKEYLLADGHHRYNVLKKLCKTSLNRRLQHNIFCYLVSWKNTQIYAFHWLLKELTKACYDNLLLLLERNFKISQISGMYSPSTPTELGLYYDHRWYALALKSKYLKTIDENSISSLVLKKYFLNLLYPRELNVSEFINFINGGDEISILESHINQEERAVAVTLRPVTKKHVSNSFQRGQCFPQHSTCFYPKPISNVIVYELTNLKNESSSLTNRLNLVN